MSGIALNSSIRASLLTLKNTTAQFDKTTNYLATGRKVSRALDNPTNYFAAVNLNDRAEGLSSRLDSMGQAVQRIQAADNGITTVRSYISAMKGVVNNALGNTDANARGDLGKQFNELIHQIGTAAADSGYQGINLLQTSGEDGESETVQFNETFDQSTLEVKGFSMEAGTYTVSSGDVSAVSASAVTGVTSISIQGITTSVDQAALILAKQDSPTAIGIQAYEAGGMSSATSAESATIDWGAAGDGYKDLLADVITQLEAYDNELKTQASALANNLSTITTREEFSTNMINTLSGGADKLTLADLNDQGANLLALQTQNQLATQSLSLASQQSQSVLQLIG